jgi:hypothetical protein
MVISCLNLSELSENSIMWAMSMTLSASSELYFVYEYINLNNVIEDTLTEYRRFPSQVKFTGGIPGETRVGL